MGVNSFGLKVGDGFREVRSLYRRGVGRFVSKVIIRIRRGYRERVRIVICGSRFFLGDRGLFFV